MFTFPQIVLILTASTTALIGGLFYAYSCSVTIGLARLPDAQYLASFQHINRAILNPVFFTSFLGTLVLLPLSTWLQYERPVSLRFIFLMIASIAYIGGVFGVTIAGNVPLNEALDKFDISSATTDGIRAQRAAFEKRWNNLNTIRTVMSVVAIICVIIACVSPGKGQANTVQPG